MSRWSVRLRVTLAAAGLFAIALTLASFALVTSVHSNLTDEIEETNEEALDQLAQQVQSGTPVDQVRIPTNGPGNQPTFRAVGPGSGDVQIPGANNGQRPGPPPTGPNATPYVQARRTIETAAGEKVTLIAERSLAEVDDTVKSITDALVIGVPVLVLVLGALTWWIAGRALRPVEAIRSEAAEITASTIHRRVPEPDTDDEVGRLARTMNSMLDRLEESSLRQRRFVSDASHELRSPVSAIRAQLEVALRRGEQADWPAVAGAVLEEDARLEQAVTELLELARAEESADIERVDVDLDDVVLSETQRERRVPVDTSRVSAGRVRGSEPQLARVVRNLLDNACRHARSQVAVAVAAQNGSVWLSVDDDGPGVPPGDRARVFDRFTRLDEGRVRDAGGMGLGLSMVKAIVDRHGGAVAIDEAPLGGARFVVRLPSSDTT
ncbi:MAG: HAMP domain-containing histidine kinase [Actinobacteria bacterium]|nr:HAMP domain-containing histidine kinase [Actinomycetota bacterium]